MGDRRHGRSVVVVRASRGIGDLLVAVPALRLLRRALPEARISLIGDESVEQLLSRFREYVDELVPFPGWPGIPERSVRTDAEALERCREADVVVQMHGDGSSSNGFCLSLAPRALAAFGPAEGGPGVVVDTRPYPRHEHEIVRCIDVAARAARLLGASIPSYDTDLEFPLLGADVSEAAECRRELEFEGRRYVVLHPGAHRHERRWSPAHFAALGRRVSSGGIVPVVTGTAPELEVDLAVADAIGPQAVLITGLLSLGATAALLSEAEGVITNDTGISHLAAAVHTPSVVVFTGSDPHRWAPLDSTLHRPVYRAAAYGEAATVTPEGRRLVPPDVADALAAAEALGLAI